MKISLMLGALLFLTVMANRPIPEIPWFALSEINEINEINEQEDASWLSFELQHPVDLTSATKGNLLSNLNCEDSQLPLSWVEMVQTPPPEVA